jgi:phage terminase small subunit
VQQRLAELAEEAKNASIADITEMQQKLTAIIRQQLEEEVVVIESTGDFMTEARKIKKTPAIKDVINAVNTLGKMQGAFVENVNLNGNVGVVIVDDIENS